MRPAAAQVDFGHALIREAVLQDLWPREAACQLKYRSGQIRAVQALRLFWN